MNIEYQVNTPISTDQFIGLLRESTLGERRPIDDRGGMEGMVKNSNLVVTAWDSVQLVGIARSVTDFSLCLLLKRPGCPQGLSEKGHRQEVAESHAGTTRSKMQIDFDCRSHGELVLRSYRL